MNIIRLCLMTKVFTCLVFLAFTASTNAQTVPPKARVDNVTDEYFGVKVTDPYRWMEDLKSEESQKWVKAQADYAQNYLERLPMRDEILKRINEVSSASVAVGDIRQGGNLFFYTRRAPDENDFKLYVREGTGGAERLLIDPNKVVGDGKRYSLGEWSISRDGKFVSYNIAAGGSEDAELRVVEAATGRDMGERIDRLIGDAANWLPDGKSFFIQLYPKLPENAPANEKNQKFRTFLHRLGSNPEKDKPIFGYGLNPDIPDGIDLIWSVETRPNWNFVLGVLSTGVTPNQEYYVAPLSALNQTPVPWRKIVSFDDEVSRVDIRGDDLYLQTYKNTPRYKVVRTSLSKPDFSKAETIVPASEAVINNLAAQRDALYVETLDGGNYRLRRVDYKTKKAEPLKLPYEGSASISGPTRPDTDGIYFNIVSWTKSRAHFKYNPKTGKPAPTDLIPPNPVDMSGIEFVNAKARSSDGTMIPLVIIYKKGLKRDGTNPVLMLGYGAYGIAYTTPNFNVGSLPWLERGGVYVWTGIRGGGEYGEEWHSAGKQKTKPNTWKDFIACAEYLIAEKYTSPQHLGIKGGSAGGITISNSIAERPELFKAAIIVNGITNTLRYETTANGPGNVPQFGSVKTEEGFRALLEMDGYLKIKDVVKYPAVLLTTGINDPRVDSWMLAKMAARLQAASVSERPVLLRVDYDAGHGNGSTKEQFNKKLADEYAFLFQQLRTTQ